MLQLADRPGWTGKPSPWPTTSGTTSRRG
jgi:hypothetical protein